MRATHRHAFSALSRAAELPGLQGKPEYGFLRTQVLRERNRLVTALRQALQLVSETLA
jgi:hypothetical protein